MIKKPVFIFVVGMLVLLFWGTAHAAGQVSDDFWNNTPQSFDCASVADIPQQECEALEGLYNSTNGPTWMNHTGWLETNTACSWYGVTCENGYVTEIDLFMNGLGGSIPAEIGGLSQLQVLTLALNWMMNGLLPAEIANLTNLVELNLMAAGLQGHIPAGLGSLGSLEQLDLSNNQFDGPIPPVLGSLNQLRRLMLDGNQLSGSIPAELGSLAALESLGLSYNRLTGPVPASLSSLSQLVELSLGKNGLEVPAYYPDVDDAFHIFLYTKDQTWHTQQAPTLNTYYEWVGFEPIEDMTCSGAHQFFRLDVPDDILFSQVRVGLNATHDNRGNLNIWLIGPNGHRVQIFGDYYAWGGNFDVLFQNDANPPELWSWHNPEPLYYEYAWKPLEPLTGFTTSQGEWQLEICDKEASATGFLMRWALDFRYDPVKPGRLNYAYFGEELTLQVAPGTPGGAWTITENLPWLDLSATAGSGTAQVTAVVDRSGLADGVYTAMITATLNAQDYPIPVTVKVTQDFCSLVTEVPYDECGMLALLYEETGGGSWMNNTFWLAHASPALWYGVRVEGGHVRQLNLARNGLSGSLTPALGNLTGLMELDLQANNLSGPIPNTIGNLTGLVELDLRANNLSGPIPNTIGNLTALTYLCVADNPMITGTIPAEIGNLTQLQTLWIGSNQLSGSLPASIGNLTQLTNLSLVNTQVGGPIPSEIGNLVNLEYLELFGNQLSGPLPPEMANLTHLTWMHLGENNYLSGPIPAWLGNLTNLEGLFLGGFMSGNQFTGPIPPELGNLTKLRYLWLNNNQLSGAIPPELGDLVNVGEFILNNNQLSGPIPAELGNLTQAYAMWLDHNQLSSAIPPELGNLTSMWMLDLSYNQLSGVIPPELGHLPQADTLNLSHNQLSGTIPPELGSLPNTTLLDLSYNQLSGAIPPELGDLARIYWLNLSYNQLSGVIPSELGDLTGMSILHLAHNQLSGDVPASFLNLVNLMDAGMMWDGGDGLTLDHNFLNVPAGYPDVGVPLHVFLHQKDPDWYLSQGARLFLPLIVR